MKQMKKRRDLEGKSRVRVKWNNNLIAGRRDNLQQRTITRVLFIKNIEVNNSLVNPIILEINRT